MDWPIRPTTASCFPTCAALTAAASQARTGQRDVWEDDATTRGATITSLEALNDQLVILPKLFRRLIDYLALGAGDIGPAATRRPPGTGPPSPTGP